MNHVADRDSDFAVPGTVRDGVRWLSQLRPWRSFVSIALDWLVISGCMVVALQWPGWLAWTAAVIVIASRQHALAVVMHDAAHYRLCRNHAWNDRWSDWLLAFPLLTTTQGYRQHHLAHHWHLNTDRDPDWLRKQGPDWEFPKTRWSLAWLLFRDVIGNGLLDMFRAMRYFRQAAGQEAKPRSFLLRLFYYAVILTALIGTGCWLEVSLLWFLPFFTLMPAIMKMRSIAEHSALAAEHELNSARNIIGAWWERLLLVPHNVHYHLDHHLYPSVPFYHLPALHRLLGEVPEYAALAHQNDTLFAPVAASVWRDLTETVFFDKLPVLSNKAGATGDMMVEKAITPEFRRHRA